MSWVSRAHLGAIAIALGAGCGSIGDPPSVGRDAETTATPADAALADARPPPADAAPPDGPPPSADAAPPPFPSFEAPQRIDELSSTESEDDPAVTGDLREIYFDRGGDIFRATRESADLPWSDPQRVDELSSSSSETTPGITPDGLTIYLASTREDENADEGQDIYRATRETRSDPFSVPELVSELSTPDTDIQAHPNATDTTIIFASDRGGRESADLFIASRDDVGDPWGTPVVLDEVSSDAGEGAGPLSSDGFLCFNSGRSGSGDLFVARRVDASAFSEPQVIENVSTSENEQDCWIAPDASTLFFAARRDGNLDLFVAEGR